MVVLNFDTCNSTRRILSVFKTSISDTGLPIVTKMLDRAGFPIFNVVKNYLNFNVNHSKENELAFEPLVVLM